MSGGLATYDILGLARGSRLADATEFFIHDTIKIFLLLSVIIFAVSVIRSYLPPERTEKIHSHKDEFIGLILGRPYGKHMEGAKRGDKVRK